MSSTTKRQKTTAPAPETPADRERRIRRRLRDDFEYYASRCLKIVPKDTGAGAIVPLMFNRAQRYLHARAEAQRAATGKVRIIGVKGRQQGFSTYVEGRAMWRVTHAKGFNVFILTHHDKATSNLFRMAKRYYENLPALVKPVARNDNANELTFGNLDSGYKVATAGGKGAGRSETIKFLHWSEVAFSPNADEHARGAVQTVPDAPGTEIFLESTSDGPGNYFHRTFLDAMKGRNEFEAVFVPWFWQEEYRTPVPEGFTLAPDEAELLAVYGVDQIDGGPGLSIENIVWRRNRISILGGSEAFSREFPNSVEEAFAASATDKLLNPLLVQAARGRDVARSYVRPIWGVDPARKGKDESALAKRIGNTKPEPVKAWQISDTMGLVGKIVNEYRQTPVDDRPSHIVVDAIGIGGPVADRLREIFEQERSNGLTWAGVTEVVDVNVSEAAGEGERFNKLRDELAWRVRDWFEAKNVSIDDDEAFVTEACAIGFSYTSNGKVKVDDKDKTRKTLGHSPDRWDAFTNTFYVAAQPRDAQRGKPTLNDDDRRGGSWAASW